MADADASCRGRSRRDDDGVELHRLHLIGLHVDGDGIAELDA